MTFGELITETFQDLRESESSPAFFTRQDVKGALNEGYQEISDETEWLEKSFTVDVLHTRPYYDLRTLIPDQVLSLGPAFNASTNRWLIPTDTRDLDGSWRQWENQIGEPERILPRGLWWVAYFPFKGAALGTVRQYYTSLPAALSLDTDVPGFPQTFHRGLVDFALHELWPQRGETGHGIAAWKQYLHYEEMLRTFVGDRASYPSARRLGRERTRK